MSDGTTPWKLVRWTVAVWLGGHALLIFGHILLVLLYSLAVAPGLPGEEYAAYAQRSGPWFSILFGAPVFYGLGRLVKRRVGNRCRTVGLAAWALYSLTDAVIVLASHGVPGALLAGQWAVSQTVKLLAMLLATRR